MLYFSSLFQILFLVIVVTLAMNDVCWTGTACYKSC